ncbi:MAG: hypothetical protein ACK52I_11755 [Pseudomonadota bacterium]|jgi:hypothetical protein
MARYLTSIDDARAALVAALGAELERLAGGSAGDPVLDVVALEPWARRAGVQPSLFVAASRRGTFPALLRVSERFHLVRRADLLAWAKRSEIGPQREKAIAAHLDDSPAEPFADCDEMTTAAARSVRARGRRAAEAARDASDARAGRQDREAKAVRG